MSELLRIGPAARYLGITTGTLRRWERLGRISCERIGWRGDRRFSREALNGLRVTFTPRAVPGPLPITRREALYVRVSGRGDQVSSLASQERELRASTRGEIVAVFRDVGSGLAERRRGLAHALDAAAADRYDVLRVTHRDRLARFGTAWIERSLALSGIRVEVLHDETGETELLADFMNLLASFSGRLYGQRSAAARRRLLDEAATHL